MLEWIIFGVYVLVIYFVSASVILPYFVVRKQKAMGLTIGDIKTEMRKESRTIINEAMDDIEVKIKKSMPDIDATIIKVKDDIKQELEQIKADTNVTDFLKPIMLELSKPPEQWDEQYFQVFSNISNIAVSQIRWMVDNDEGFNKWFYDKLKGLSMNLKKEMRAEMTEAIPEIAKGFGLNPDMIKEGADMFETIPEEYRGWAQLFFAVFKGGGIPGMGGGAGGGATTPYGGF